MTDPAYGRARLSRHYNLVRHFWCGFFRLSAVDDSEFVLRTELNACAWNLVVEQWPPVVVLRLASTKWQVTAFHWLPRGKVRCRIIWPVQSKRPINSTPSIVCVSNAFCIQSVLSFRNREAGHAQNFWRSIALKMGNKPWTTEERKDCSISVSMDAKY